MDWSTICFISLFGRKNRHKSSTIYEAVQRTKGGTSTEKASWRASKSNRIPIELFG